MAGLSDVIGHDQAVEQLRGAISTGRVSHAYLFEGAAGTGKRMLAEAFAQTLLCSGGGGDACGVCHDCRRALAHTHPDIIYVTHENPGIIKIDEVRKQLISDIAVRPYEGKYKIYLMEDAERMNANAQNALLKTLEEPPEYAVIILMTVNADALLDTIRSRCVPVVLRPVRDDLVIRYLMEHVQIPDYQARLCAAFAQGSIGKAMELARSENFSQIRTTALMLVTRAREMDISHIIATVKDMSQYKVTINEFLDILAVWYRDVLYFKATRSANTLIFQDQLQQIRETAMTSSYEGIEKILGAISQAKSRLDADVNFNLTMELLFMTIKEN